MRATRLAGGLDAVLQETLHDVYEHAGASPEAAKAAADRFWDGVSGATAFPLSATGELWVAVLDLALNPASALGVLCQAAALARRRNTPWRQFLASVCDLKNLAGGAAQEAP